MSYRPRILVVEDDPASQDMLVRRLAARGFRVATVADGESCLHWLAAEGNDADLILLDINLPGISGLDVLKKLRETTSLDRLPIILVTALADSEDVIRGLEAGANDYITKPIHFAVLLARLGVHLRIKFDVTLLMEAERQRVLIGAIGESCHQLAQPMTAVTMTLESLIRHPPDDPKEIQRELREVLRWTGEVGDVIHRMQNVATFRAVPYTQRMEMFTGPGQPASPGAPEGASGSQSARG